MIPQQPLFISNVNILHPRGGWDGLGGKIFSLLGAQMDGLGLVENVNPPVHFLPKAFSKGLRKIGLRGGFPIFSNGRLNQVERMVTSAIPPDTDYLIFHGATPWVKYDGRIPYCAFLDCSFMTYMNIYHDISLFSKRDLKRIMLAEKSFFEKAHKIFFTTQWAIEDTRKRYDIKGANFFRIGQGPSTPTPPIDPLPVTVNKQFLFIGTDFLGKGGAEVCNSFQKLLIQYPDYELVIVGQRPPEHFLSGKNIRFVGFVNKSVPEGLAQLEKLYRESRALVMMTRKDIAPLVVIEAGLQGCLTIANDVTALGEMVKDGHSGFLIGNKENDLLEAMLKVAGLSDPSLNQLRSNAQSFLAKEFGWNHIINNMINHIKSS